MKGLSLDNGGIAAGVFDLDGNLFNVPTVNYFFNKTTRQVEEVLGTEIDKCPEDFFGPDAKYEFVNGDLEQSLRSYKDVSPYGEEHKGFEGLMEDIKATLADNMLAPSFYHLKDIFLTKGRIACILTARGHSPDNLQRCMEFVNNEMLDSNEKREQIDAIRDNYILGKDITDTQVLNYYFREIWDFIPASNPHVQKAMGLHNDSPSVRKVEAMNWYIPEAHRKLEVIGKRDGKTLDQIITPEHPLCLGFSDDSVSNIIQMGTYFGARIPENHKFRMYYTGDSEKHDDIRNLLTDAGSFREIEEGENTLLQVRVGDFGEV